MKKRGPRSPKAAEVIANLHICLPTVAEQLEAPPVIISGYTRCAQLLSPQALHSRQRSAHVTFAAATRAAYLHLS